MNTLAILYLWTVVSAGSGGRLYYDWRPVGEYSSIVSCEKARQKLGVATDVRSRCVEKN